MAQGELRRERKVKQSAVKASAIWARQQDNRNVGGGGSAVVRSGEEEVRRMLCEMSCHGARAGL